MKVFSTLAVCTTALVGAAYGAGVASPPVNWGVMVFPSFQALDVFGPLDFLNMVSLNRKLKLTVIGPTLDPVSTKPTAMNAAGSDFGQSILPTHTFANPPKDLEVLLVPGGLGTRSPAPWVQEAVQFINQTYPNLKYIVSVCTGASFLARAGVLEGKHATTNKRSWAFVTGFGGPNVHWVPVARWVADGKVWSTSGVAAGMDGMLGFIEYLYGTDVAWEFANGSEYEWHSDPSWDPFAKFWNVPGSNATQLGQFEQCGGKEYSGSTACKAPYLCKNMDSYFSQCQ